MKVGGKLKERLDSIDLRHSGDENNKVLLKTLYVRTRVLNGRFGLPVSKAIAFEIPKDFTTDGASIPRPLWWFINPLSWWILFPAIVHDFVWRFGFVYAYIVDLHTMTVEDELGTIAVSKQEANKIMLEKMQSFFGGFIQRYLVYYALQIGAHL